MLIFTQNTVKNPVFSPINYNILGLRANNQRVSLSAALRGRCGYSHTSGCQQAVRAEATQEGFIKADLYFLLVCMGMESNHPGQPPLFTSPTFICQGTVCFQNSQHDLFICGGSLVFLVTHSPSGDLCNFPCSLNSSSLVIPNQFFLMAAKMSVV